MEKILPTPMAATSWCFRRGRAKWL